METDPITKFGEPRCLEMVERESVYRQCTLPVGHGKYHALNDPRHAPGEALMVNHWTHEARRVKDGAMESAIVEQMNLLTEAVKILQTKVDKIIEALKEID